MKYRNLTHLLFVESPENTAYRKTIAAACGSRTARTVLRDLIAVKMKDGIGGLRWLTGTIIAAFGSVGFARMKKSAW